MLYVYVFVYDLQIGRYKYNSYVLNKQSHLERVISYQIESSSSARLIFFNNF